MAASTVMALGKHFVLDLDKLQSFVGDMAIDRGDCGYRVTIV